MRCSVISFLWKVSSSVSILDISLPPCIPFVRQPPGTLSPLRSTGFPRDSFGDGPIEPAGSVLIDRCQAVVEALREVSPPDAHIDEPEAFKGADVPGVYFDGLLEGIDRLLCPFHIEVIQAGPDTGMVIGYSR